MSKKIITCATSFIGAFLSELLLNKSEIVGIGNTNDYDLETYLVVKDAVK